MNISPNECRAVSAEIDAAIQPILAKYGLMQDERKSQYGDRYQIKISAHKTVTGDDGIDRGNPKVQAWLRIAPTLGIADASAPMTEPFTIMGKTMVVTGYNTRARRRPIMVRDINDGKEYVIDENIVKHMPTYDYEPLGTLAD